MKNDFQMILWFNVGLYNSIDMGALNSIVAMFRRVFSKSGSEMELLQCKNLEVL